MGPGQLSGTKHVKRQDNSREDKPGRAMEADSMSCRAQRMGYRISGRCTKDSGKLLHPCAVRGPVSVSPSKSHRQAAQPLFCLGVRLTCFSPLSSAPNFWGFFNLPKIVDTLL